MSLWRVLKQKGKTFKIKIFGYNFLNEFFTQENIRIMAFVFILTKIKTIYNLTIENIILIEVLETIVRKQGECLKQVKKIDYNKKLNDLKERVLI